VSAAVPHKPERDASQPQPSEKEHTMDFPYPPRRQNEGSRAPLPRPTAKMKRSGSAQQFTEEEVRGIIANPICAGVGPFPRLVSDEQWVRAAVQAIREDGAEQFLVNLLHVLRQTFPEQ
jgi:hypothetical protein